MKEEQKQLFRDDCLTYYNFAKEDVEGIIASMIYWGQNFTSVKEFTQYISKKTKE